MRSSFRVPLTVTVGVVSALWTVPALAHVSVASPAFAGQTQLLTFSVGHGCAGADTVSVEVDIPPEIVSLRALVGPFGEATVETSSTGAPRSVTWSKLDARMADDHYYQLQVRALVPNAPFTTLLFGATQVCRTAAGEERTVQWRALPGEEGEPAAALAIVPQRYPGWNKLTVPTAIEDLGVFKDAQIVWAGEAA